MFNFIERLQQASLAKRRSIVIGVSTAVTLVVFGFWLITFTRATTPVVADSGRKIESSQGASPFTALKKAIGSIFDGSTSMYER